jgi:hypothetical protein
VKTKSIRDELLEASKGYAPTRKRWTAAEDALLDEFYGKVPTQLLAKKLGKGVAAVRWRGDARKRGDL